MMKKLLENRHIQLTLGLAVILVWGYNMVTLTGITVMDKTSETNPGVTIEAKMLELPEHRQITYKGEFRDPFYPELKPPQRKAVARKKPDPPPKPVVLPPFELSGIVDGTAFIQNRKTKTFYFAAAGDMVEGARIHTLTADSVMFVYKNKEFVLKLK
jgi:hypothetical protein